MIDIVDFKVKFYYNLNKYKIRKMDEGKDNTKKEYDKE